MAQRTTKIKVQAVLDTGFDYNAGKDLQPFIDSANSMVDDIVTCATSKSITLSDAKLELIERWLSCWFYKGPDPAYQSRSTANRSGSFQGQSGMYLEDNRYGQRAKALDSSGCLIALVPGADGMRKKAFGRWTGKRPTLQTNYVDRR